MVNSPYFRAKEDLKKETDPFKKKVSQFNLLKSVADLKMLFTGYKKVSYSSVMRLCTISILSCSAAMKNFSKHCLLGS